MWALPDFLKRGGEVEIGPSCPRDWSGDLRVSFWLAYATRSRALAFERGACGPPCPWAVMPKRSLAVMLMVAFEEVLHDWCLQGIFEEGRKFLKKGRHAQGRHARPGAATPSAHFEAGPSYPSALEPSCSMPSCTGPSCPSWSQTRSPSNAGAFQPTVGPSHRMRGASPQAWHTDTCSPYWGRRCG